MIYKTQLNEQEYQQLRMANMHGDITAKFWRGATNNVVSFSTKNPQQLVTELESIIDSGETSWTEILQVKV